MPSRLKVVAAGVITDEQGTVLATGVITFVPTDAGDNPIPIRLAADGNTAPQRQAIPKPVMRTITNGSIDGADLYIANPATTDPPNIFHRITVTDLQSGFVSVLRRVQVVDAGDGTWNLGSWQTGLSSPTVPMTFVVGPQGIPGTGSMKAVKYVFASAGTAEVAHYLGTMNVLTQAILLSGTGIFSAIPSGSNSVTISVPAPMSAVFLFSSGDAAPATATNNQDIASDLYAHWPMNEGSGVAFVDAVSGNNMTVANAAWGAATGVAGGVDVFAQPATSDTSVGGAQAAVAIPFDSSTALSLCFWLNWDVYPSVNGQSLDCMFISNQTPGETAGFSVRAALGTPANSLQFSLGDPANGGYVETAVNTLTPGAKQFIAITYDGSRSPAGARIYINGTAMALVILSAGLGFAYTSSATLPLAAMCCPDPTQVSGRSLCSGGWMRNLRYYGRALTPAQVANVMAQGA